MAIHLVEAQKTHEHPLLREWVADSIRDMIAKGKLKHDKRASEREKEWQREKTRLLRAR